MKTTQLLTAVLALRTFASAWPWPPSLPDMNGYGYGQIEDVLGRRQEGGNTKPASTTTDSSSDSSSNTNTDNATPAPKTTSKPTATSNSKNTPGGKGTSRTVAQNAGAGGIQMITPAATAATSVYYSVGSTITWAWNYTSLVNPPARIDILATMAPPPNGGGAPQPYTLGTNVTWNKLQNYTWDSGKYASKTGFRNGIYTLIVYDAEVSGGVTAVPVGGSLGVNKQFHFGMYNGQDYTELANPYQCATCNSAMGRVGRLTVWGVLGMVGVTVASFTWFAVGFGAF